MIYLMCSLFLLYTIRYGPYGMAHSIGPIPVFAIKLLLVPTVILRYNNIFELPTNCLFVRNSNKNNANFVWVIVLLEWSNTICLTLKPPHLSCNLHEHAMMRIFCQFLVSFCDEKLRWPAGNKIEHTYDQCRKECSNLDGHVASKNFLKSMP